jgi:hypothetical protein
MRLAADLTRRDNREAMGIDELIRLARLLRSGLRALIAVLSLHFLAMAAPVGLTLVAPRWAAAIHWIWPWAECAAAVLAGLGLCRIEVAMSGWRERSGWRWLLLAAAIVVVTLMWFAFTRPGWPDSHWWPALLTSVEWLRTAVVIVALVWLNDLVRRLKTIFNRPWHEPMLLHLAMAVVVLSVIVKVALLTMGSILAGIALRDGVNAPALQWFRAHAAPFALAQVGASLLWPIPILGVLLDGVHRLGRIERGRCLRCGYDLRGEFDHPCPECGWQRDAGSP